MVNHLYPVPPLFKGKFEGEEFTVADVIVSFHRGELLGKEGAWGFGRFALLL